jgi:transcriptional regulator with XRE-family HTH domain
MINQSIFDKPKRTIHSFKVTTQPDDSRPFLNEIFVQARKLKNLTQKDVSKLSGYSLDRIRQIEHRGNAITWNVFERLCIAMGVIPAITIEDLTFTGRGHGLVEDYIERKTSVNIKQEPIAEPYKEIVFKTKEKKPMSDRKIRQLYKI